ncbi:hypothetical protein E2F50_03220 [Rhizobium deserti]|uniref:Uncharacterized protein n=1 Tax=Rhizobium deserti TaxID=2547961 RepID=A0A4R5UMN6_9HYPH|nr:hypothetical protein [Rhizobium deserti]TDK39152.1 hypothetical protein E2F50_03220 [Rhizobium deserti]
MAEDKQAQQAVENIDTSTTSASKPPAGPHAREDLTDNDKTPGTGALPEANSEDTDAGSG